MDLSSSLFLLVLLEAPSIIEEWGLPSRGEYQDGCALHMHVGVIVAWEASTINSGTVLFRIPSTTI